MLDSILKLIIGDPDEKKAYKQFEKQIDALPKDYRFAFHKIQNYMYSVGPADGDMTMFTDLTMFKNIVELFATSAAEGKQVLDIIGSDVGKFCDELMRASVARTETPQEKLNKEIMKKLNKEVD